MKSASDCHLVSCLEDSRHRHTQTHTRFFFTYLPRTLLLSRLLPNPHFNNRVFEGLRVSIVCFYCFPPDNLKSIVQVLGMTAK